MSRLPRRWRRWTRPLLALAVVGGAAVAAPRVVPILFAPGGRGVGGAAAVVLLLILSCVTSIPPASLVAMAAGAIFGLALGWGIASVGLLLGAITPFLLARYALRDRVRGWLHRWPRAGQVDGVVARGGWRAVALLRLSPVMPFGPLSYALGFTAIPLGPYLAGSCAALPSLAVYVSLGVAAGDLVAVGEGQRPATVVQVALLVVGVVALAATVVYLRRLLRQQVGEAAEVAEVGEAAAGDAGVKRSPVNGERS